MSPSVGIIANVGKSWAKSRSMKQKGDTADVARSNDVFRPTI